MDEDKEITSLKARIALLGLLEQSIPRPSRYKCTICDKMVNYDCNAMGKNEVMDCPRCGQHSFLCRYFYDKDCKKHMIRRKGGLYWYE